MNRFRVMFIPQLGNGSVFYSQEFGSFDMCNSILNQIASYTIFIQDEGLMDDMANIGTVQQFYEGEWIDFDEEDLN